MSQHQQRADITKRPVVYRLPGMEAVPVRRDLPYATTAGGELTMDLYSARAAGEGARPPVVIIVAGYPDPGIERILGCKFKEMASCISWAQLAASSGVAAITYTNREPVADLGNLLQYIRQHATELGIDAGRIAVWASSGNAPLALSLLLQEAHEQPKCAVLCYGLLLDLDGSSSVAEMSGKFGFANPCAGKSVAHLVQDVPLFLARAGQDEFPHLNETMDRFLAEALHRNLPITLVNHPAAPHAFDLLHDSETSRSVIRQILVFLRFHLLAQESDSG
jgi:dienelactone hydrolase